MPGDVNRDVRYLTQMTDAIREHLDELEDLYLAEQRLIALHEGRSRTYSLEEAVRD